MGNDDLRCDEDESTTIGGELATRNGNALAAFEFENRVFEQGGANVAAKTEAETRGRSVSLDRTRLQLNRAEKRLDRAAILRRLESLGKRSFWACRNRMRETE